MFLKHLTS